MYTNTSLEVIQDNAPYTDSEGVKYPSNFPKDEIAELFAVTLCDCPECDVSEGYHIELIGETYTQMWDTRGYSQEELDTQAKQQWEQEMSKTDYGVNGISREMEDHYDKDHGGLSSDKFINDKLIAKKAKRQEGKDKGYI